MKLNLTELNAIYGALEYALQDMTDPYKLTDVAEYVKADECLIEDIQDKISEAIAAREYAVNRAALRIIADQIIANEAVTLSSTSIKFELAEVITDALRSKHEKDIADVLIYARKVLLNAE